MPVPSRFGSEFHVNTTTAGSQSSPSVTALPNGGYVAVWEDSSQTGGDTVESAVRGQVYRADGTPVGGEFLVNQVINGSEIDPVVTALEGGRFVVAWTHRLAGSAIDIRARIYNADGAPAGNEFVVNTASGSGEDPSVAALADGGFVVTWTHITSSTDLDLRGRAFNAAGTPLGVEFSIDSTAGTSERGSTVIGLQNGNYMVVWEDDGSATETDGSGSHLRGMIMSGNGTVVVNEFIINSTTADDAPFASAAVLSDGNIIVTWTQTQLTADGGADIRGRVFSPNGVALAPDFLIEGDAEVERFPTVGALANGAYVVAWDDLSGGSQPDTDTDGSPDHVRARIFTGVSGTPISDEFVVNGSTDGTQFLASLATLADGRFVGVWTDNAGNLGDLAVRGQIFDPRTQAVAVGGTEGNDQLIGTAFDDTLKGFGGDDRLEGAGGNDFLQGGTGADLLIGGDGGSDTADYAPSTSGVQVHLSDGNNAGGDAEGDTLVGIENVTGSGLGDNLIGDGKGNGLRGLFGTDFLNGGDGNDVIEGGAGNDTMIGGAGIDTLSYASSSAGVVVNLGASGALGGDAAGDTMPLFDFENISGSAHDDNLIGNQLANVLDGGSGRDFLFGDAGNDVLEGGAGDDTLMGGKGGDQLRGGDGTDVASYASSTVGLVLDLRTPSLNTGDAAGDTFSSVERFVGSTFNDRMEGNSGDNHLNGGNGNDTVNGNDGNDRIAGGAGADTLAGGDGIDTLDYLDGFGVVVDLRTGIADQGFSADTFTGFERVIGSQFADTLRGTDTDNVLDGASGDDVVEGFGGNDRLEGGAGNDKLNGGDGTDEVIGQSGNDKLDGANGDDLVRGGDGDDAIEGRDGNDRLEGEAGADTIDAGAGNDLLFGGDGNDRLFAAGGTDTLTGGAGNDQFFYTNTAPGQINGDTITDFQSVAGANTGDTLLIHAGFSGIVFNNGSTAITYNGVTETLFHPGVTLSLANDILVV